MQLCRRDSGRKIFQLEPHREVKGEETLGFVGVVDGKDSRSFYSRFPGLPDREPQCHTNSFVSAGPHHFDGHSGLATRRGPLNDSCYRHSNI